MRISLILSGFCLAISQAHADYYSPLYRGPRAQAMGNAFTAVADDEQAIFYNPAGLAGVKGFTFNFASISAESSNDLATGIPTLSDSLSNPGITSANALMGKNYSERLQATSSLILPRFGIAAIATEEAAIRLENSSRPTGMYGMQTTYGFQAGFGVPVWKLKKKRGELRFGFAGKMLWRAGSYVQPTLTDIMTLNMTKLKGNFTDFGLGVGFDLGLQFVRPIRKKLFLQAGLAWKDIGDTSFSSGGSAQKNNLTAGIAAIYQGADLRATFAYDFDRILESMDWKKKNHFGMELKFPLLSLSVGMSQTSPTYGAGLDFVLFKVMYSSYAEELATFAGQNSERRHLLYLTFKLDSG